MLVGCNAPPPVPTSPSEKELTTYQMEIDLLGTRHEVLADVQGRLKTNVELASADGKVSLVIDKDTRLIDKDEKSLQHIRVTIAQISPLPPEGADIIGAIYELSPQGATVDPPLRLILSYDPEELPEGLSEGNVYIAPYDEETGWGKSYYKRVDTENHRVTTQVNCLAKFAVLAPVGSTLSQSAPAPSSKLDLDAIPLEPALSSGKPTLAEFGRGICIPCKQMKPILEELAVEYQDKLKVVIVEIDEHRDLTRQHGIMAIPTQIFFDSNGKEVTRHMGFWSKEEIITQLKKMGIE